MGEVDSRQHLSQLIVQTRRQTIHDGPGSSENVLTILPIQHRGFWETAETKELVAKIDADIRDQLQDTRVKGSGYKQSTAAAGLNHAAASVLRKHSTAYINGISSRIEEDVHQGPTEDIQDVDMGIFHDSKPWYLGSESGSDASFGRSDVVSRLEQIRGSPDPSALLKHLCASYDILDLADSEDEVFKLGLNHLLTAACTSQASTHADFLKAFVLIASAIEGRQPRLHATLDLLLQSEFQPCSIDLSSVVHQLLKALPESCRCAPGPATRSAAAVAANVAKALRHTLTENVAEASTECSTGSQLYKSQASHLLSCDQEISWWMQLMAMPLMAKPLIQAAFHEHVPQIALKNLKQHAGAGSPENAAGSCLTASVSVLLSMLSTRSRADCWQACMDNTHEPHESPKQHHDDSTPQSFAPAPSEAISQVLNVLLDVKKNYFPATFLSKAFRMIRVIAAHAPSLLHHLCDVLPSFVEKVLEDLSNLGTRQMHDVHAYERLRLAPSHHHPTHESEQGDTYRNSERHDNHCPQPIETCSMRLEDNSLCIPSDPERIQRMLACMQGMASIFVEMTKIQEGRSVILPNSTDSVAGSGSFSSAVSTLLSKLPKVGEKQSRNGQNLATSVLAIWLRAVADISASPHACTQHLQPVYDALAATLDFLARSRMHGDAVAPGSHSAEAPGSHSSPQLDKELVDPIAKLCRVNQLATATMLALPEHSKELLVYSLARKFAAQVAVAAGTVAADTTEAARVARSDALACASDMMHAMHALAVCPTTQRLIISTGVDAALARALAVAPLARGPADDEALVSVAVAGVVKLLQARMRWPSAAQVAARTTEDTGETVTAQAADEATMERPTSALIGLLKQLNRGEDARLCNLQTFEDPKLILSALLLPWLGDVTGEALLATLEIPTSDRKLPSPMQFITSSCCSSLGLETWNASSSVSSLHLLQPPGVHDHVHDEVRGQVPTANSPCELPSAVKQAEVRCIAEKRDVEVTTAGDDHEHITTAGDDHEYKHDKNKQEHGQRSHLLERHAPHMPNTLENTTPALPHLEEDTAMRFKSEIEPPSFRHEVNEAEESKLSSMSQAQKPRNNTFRSNSNALLEPGQGTAVPMDAVIAADVAISRCFLPFGLLWAGDCSAYTAARNRAHRELVAESDAQTGTETSKHMHDVRGFKRTRSKGDVVTGQLHCKHGQHSTSGTTYDDTFAQLRAFATSDPAMHGQHAWRRSAAAVLAAHFTSCSSRMFDSSALGGGSGRSTMVLDAECERHVIAVVLHRALVTGHVEHPGLSTSSSQQSSKVEIQKHGNHLEASLAVSEHASTHILEPSGSSMLEDKKEREEQEAPDWDIKLAIKGMSNWVPMSEEHAYMLESYHTYTPSKQEAPQLKPAHPSLPPKTPVLQLPALLSSDSSELTVHVHHAHHVLGSFGLIVNAPSPTSDKEEERERYETSEAGGGYVKARWGVSEGSKKQKEVEEEGDGGAFTVTECSTRTQPDPKVPLVCSAHGRTAPIATEVAFYAQLQHACSVACSHNQLSSALPEVDAFLLLMHTLFYGTIPKTLPGLLEAVSALPAGQYAWPKYSFAMHGPRPMLMLCFTARSMLAQELPDVFSVLEDSQCMHEILLKWLQASLLPILSVRCACHVTVLALVGSPLILPAAVVASFGALRPRLLSIANGSFHSENLRNSNYRVSRSAAGDSSDVDAWLHAAHCFDVNESELISHTLDIEGRHRSALLPLLMQRSRSTDDTGA